MLENAPDRILYCYGQFQSGFVDLQKALSGVEFIHGLGPVLDNPDFLNTPTLLVLDD